MDEWIDITSELMSTAKEMKLLEVIKDDGISLEDCMQAQQINDQKMDPKFDINPKYTIGSLLADNRVQLPHQLSYPQMIAIMQNVIQLEAAILRGQPSSSTIYQFSYLYDPAICKDHFLMKPLVHSINCFGTYIYELVKSSCSVKEDDINLSSFSFDKDHESNQNIIDMLLQAEKKLEAELKNHQQSKEDIKALVSLFRFRRFLHIFIGTATHHFNSKTLAKFSSDLQSVRKRLVVVSQLEINTNQLLKSVFFPCLTKTLRSHYGPKNSKILPFKESLSDFQNALNQLELLIPTPSKISEYKNRIQMLECRPYNAWSKSYIKANIFAKEQYFFGTVKIQDSLIQDINDWTHLKENLKQNEKFIKLISNAAPVVNETLYRLLGNSMRWFWECSKIYEDYNIIIHLANQLDTEISSSPNREMYVCSWFYYYGLNLTIRQILTGFEINLYQSSELIYVLYVLENFLTIFERNAQIYIRKMDKVIHTNFYQGNLTKKMKKKMTENSKRMFCDTEFKKGLQLYVKALMRVVSILRQRKLIPNPFDDSEEIRIKNRFRIFKNIMFTKVIEFSEYTKTLEEISKDQTSTLEGALESLKESKAIFQLIDQQFEENQTFFKQKEEAKELQKMSVKLSLVVMSLKMSAPNKKYTIKCSTKYPEVVVE